MARTLLFFAAFLLLASEVDAQGRGGGGAPGGMRAGGGIRVGGGMGGSSMRGSSLHGPSSAMRGPSASMRGPSSMMRSPSLSMRSGSYSSFRHPHDIGRSHSSYHHGAHSSIYHGSHSSIYHRPHSSYDYGTIGSIYPRPSYPSTSYGLHLRSYPSYANRYLYGGYYPYGYSAYSSLLDSTLYVSPSVVVVPSTRAYNSPSPTISSAAIVPSRRPAYDAASGPERLARSLASRSGGDVWLEYLAPDRVSELIESDNAATLAAELVQRYDGVHNNPALAWIANMSGFAATRNLLHQHANATGTDVDVSGADEPEPNPPPVDDQPEETENLPLPLPAPTASLEDAV